MCVVRLSTNGDTLTALVASVALSLGRSIRVIIIILGFGCGLPIDLVVLGVY